MELDTSAAAAVFFFLINFMLSFFFLLFGCIVEYIISQEDRANVLLLL
jgi:hypothetical protein